MGLMRLEDSEPDVGIIQFDEEISDFLALDCR
jgi:hypothetical protein